MEVSHFELIFKPQSPAAPTGVAAVDRLIQGYFLAITNLEDVEYRYRLDFVAVPPPPGQPQRSLSGNTLVFVDSPGVDNQQGVLNGSLTAEVFRPSTGFVRIAPRATALVAVLPSAFGPFPGEPTPLTTPNFEVRGFVRIALPALFPGGIGSFVSVPQATAPVRVLLTPQNRTTYFTAAGAISDQTQASLPLAGGSAIASLAPEPGGPLVLTPLPGTVSPITPMLPRLIELMPDIDPTQLLAGLMAQIDPATTDFAPFNRALAEAGIGVALERRKVKT